MEPRRRVSEGDSLKRVLYWAANRPRCQKPSLFATDVTVPPSHSARASSPRASCNRNALKLAIGVVLRNPALEYYRDRGPAGRIRSLPVGHRLPLKSWSSSGSSEPTSVGIGLGWGVGIGDPSGLPVSSLSKSSASWTCCPAGVACSSSGNSS